MSTNICFELQHGKSQASLYKTCLGHPICKLLAHRFQTMSRSWWDGSRLVCAVLNGSPIFFVDVLLLCLTSSKFRSLFGLRFGVCVLGCAIVFCKVSESSACETHCCKVSEPSACETQCIAPDRLLEGQTGVPKDVLTRLRDVLNGLLEPLSGLFECLDVLSAFRGVLDVLSIGLRSYLCTCHFMSLSFSFHFPFHFPFISFHFLSFSFHFPFMCFSFSLHFLSFPFMFLSFSLDFVSFVFNFLPCFFHFVSSS